MVRKLWHEASELPPPTLQKKIWKWPLPDFLLEGRGRLYIGWQHVTSGTFCLRAFISLDYLTISLLGRAWYYFKAFLLFKQTSEQHFAKRFV